MLFKLNKYLWHTVLFQSIQVIGFCILGIKYIFCAGSLFVIGYNFPFNNIYSAIKPIGIEFTVGKNIENSFIYINIIPIIIIILIIKL
ncbi:hypothetical protein GCM10027346_29340 [Hymenobacter seoulensis]